MVDPGRRFVVVVQHQRQLAHPVKCHHLQQNVNHRGCKSFSFAIN